MTVGRYAQLRSGTKVDLLLNLQRLRLVPEMMALVVADKPGIDLSQMAVDLKTIMAVHLSADELGQGARSGELLRQRRCQALGERS
jgi:tRNA nucleotidyltransferase (CCA-adding enzyme)